MKHIKYIISTLLFIGMVGHGYSQKSTEIFIPLGKSPGLSGKHTLIGTVEKIDLQDSSLTILTENGGKTVKMKGPSRRVWLDYSRLKASNKMGVLTDIKAGLRVEIKFTNNQMDNLIEWIKVEMKDLD